MIFKDNTTWPTHGGLFAIGDYTAESHCIEGHVFIKTHQYRDADFVDADENIIELVWAAVVDEDSSEVVIEEGRFMLSLPILGETIVLDPYDTPEWGTSVRELVAHLPTDIRGDIIQLVYELADIVDSISDNCTAVRACFRHFQNFWNEVPEHHLIEYVDYALNPQS